MVYVGKDQGAQMASEAERYPSVVERKLVTILSADVAEYSRLMAEDEEHTLRIFREHTHTFRALVDMHHGRIFNTAGDALLAEFTSPIEAVRCATDIQAALRTRNDLLPRNRQVRFRIGVNLGDVMMQGSDLLGDGVNVAARLQGAAEPGGICISGSVYDQIRNKLSLSIESLGERRFKNIPQPVRTFTIAGTEDDRLFVPAPKKSSFAPGLLLKSAVAALPRLSLSRGLMVKSGIAGLALLVLAGGYWAYSSYKPSPTHLSKVGPKSTATAPLNVTTLDIQSSALLADAQRLHRPQEEIDSLTDSNTQMVALAKQLHEMGTTKIGDRTKARALFAQMKTLAVDMSHNEATALQHAAAPLWRDLEKPPGKSVAADAEAAITKAQQAKASLDNAVAAVQQAQDGLLALKATSQALTAYDAFAAACEAAAPFYISARRSDFSAVAAAAHSISDRLVALGRVDKPWLLASHARKDAYQTLSSNATQAQSQVAELDELQRRVDAATSLKKISAAMSRASSIKARLNGLLANSNAAYTIYNQ
jgi:class 3 adenylate cyclase